MPASCVKHYPSEKGGPDQGWQYCPARVFPPRENPGWVIMPTFAKKALLPSPGFPGLGKPGLGNNAFLAKVGNNGQ